MTKQIALIAGVDTNYGMGLNGKLPWSHKADMNYFKETTHDSICIMGRSTYEEILSFKKDKTSPLLKNRISYVVSSTLTQPDDDHIFVMPGIDYAVEYANAMYPEKNIFFTGGRRIYEGGIKYINKIYLNQILHNYNCNLLFPYYLLEDFCHDKTIVLADDLLNIQYSR